MMIKKSFILPLISLIIFIGFFGVVSAVVSSITVISPNGGEFWSGTQQITWTATGSDGDTVDIAYSIGGGWTTIASLVPFDGSFTWDTDTPTVSDGNNYQIRVKDTNSNVNDVSNAVFTIDNTAPSVDARPDKTANAEFTQNGVVSDNFNIASIVWTQTSGPGTVTFGSPNSEVTTIQADTDGTYVLRLTATDEAGNSAFDEMILSWDNTPPAVAFYTLNGEEANAFFNPGTSDTVEIFIIANEPVEFNSIKILDSAPSEVKFFTQVEVFQTTTTKIWDGTGQTGDGVYTLQVNIEDAAGNTVNNLDLTPHTITVDTQSPTISALSEPQANAVYKTGSTIPITFTPTDPAPGTPLTCGYKVNDGQVVELGSCTSGVVFTGVISESDLADGRNDIFGIVMDSAGNTAETSPVSIVFDNDNTLSVPSDFTTIQAAIDAASSGDTINVAEGTYEEQLTIDKSLTLSGDVGDASAGPGINAPVLDGGGVVGSAITINGGVSDVTIQGFEIRNYKNREIPKFTTGGIGSAVLAWNSLSINNVIIKDNFMHDLGWNGVLVGNEGQALHDNWLVASNRIANAAFVGIELTNTKNSNVIGNVITGGTAIFFSDDNSDDAILIQTQIHTGAGLTVSNVTVENNSISGTFDRAGIELLSWTSTDSSTANLNNINVVDNNVSGAKRGIYIFSIIFSFTEPQPSGASAIIDNVNITGNILDGNGDGIQIRDLIGGTHGTITITNNSIINSTEPSSGIHLLSGTSAAGILVNENILTNNLDKDINHEGTGTLNAEDNWWGTNDGTQIAGLVNGDVDFTPWAYNSNVNTDHDAPTSTINSPAAGSWHNSNFNAELEYLDTGGAGLADGECKYKVVSKGDITENYKSAGACSGNNEIISKLITVGGGLNCRNEGTNICEVFVKVEDNSGNEGTEVSRTFSIDFTNPIINTVVVTTPTSNPTQTITGTFTELNIDTITVNGVSATITGSTYSAANVPLTEGTNTITVVATDLAGNSVTDNSNSITLDTLLPEITGLSDFGVEVDSSISVTATVTDTNGIASVTLHYTVEGESELTEPMTPSGDDYTGSIPSQSSSTTISYFVVAQDNAGNLKTSSTFTITVNDLIWDLNSQWNLVSVPKTLAEKNKITLLPSNTVHEYDAKAGTFVTNPITINPGIGYWVDNSGKTSLGLDYATLTSNQTLPSETIILEQGWNLIGHMCTNSQLVEVAFPSDVYDNLFVLRYDEANDLFQIHATQDPGSAQFTQMVPGEGYWVFVVREGGVPYTNFC